MNLRIHLCQDAKEAYSRGFFYREPIYKAVEITDAVVVNNGTETGKATVDLIFKDGKGQKYHASIKR